MKMTKHTKIGKRSKFKDVNNRIFSRFCVLNKAPLTPIFLYFVLYRLSKKIATIESYFFWKLHFDNEILPKKLNCEMYYIFQVWYYVLVG